MNRFRNAYRTRYCKTESSHQNQFDHYNDEKAVIKDLFDDIIEVAINTVSPHPVDWSTPVGLKSETASVPIKEGLLAPTRSEAYVTIASKDSKSTYCGQEWEQKDDCSALFECTAITKKNNCGPGKQMPNMTLNDDEARHVYLAQGSSGHAEEDISEAAPNPEMHEKPADYLYAFDISAVLEPSSPTVKVQARKRLSFKDKATPSYISKIQASEMPKQVQPEEQIKPLMLMSKSGTSQHRSLQKDAGYRSNLHSKEITDSATKQTGNEAEKVEKTKAGSKILTSFLENDQCEMLSLYPSEKLRNKFASMLIEATQPQQRSNLHSKEITGSATKQTGNKAEKVEKTKAGSKVLTTFLENDQCEMLSLCPSEKPRNKFASMLVEASHPQQRLSVKATCPPPPPLRAPSPLSTINGLEEEFVIDETDSFTFASWERDLKKGKSSRQLSKTAADGKRKQEKTISSQAYTSICSLFQTSVNDKSLFAATTINILPSSNRKNKVIVKKYQVPQTFTGEKDICQELSAPLAVEKPDEPHEKNAVLLTDHQVHETTVKRDIPSLMVAPSDELTTKVVVPVSGDVYKEVTNYNFSADVKKNVVPLKRKMRPKKAAYQTLAKTLKKKKAIKAATLEKASLEMQKNDENASNYEAETSLPQTNSNENHFPISCLSSEGLVPIDALKKIPQQSFTEKVIEKPNVKVLKESHLVRHVKDHTKDPSDEDLTGPKAASIKVCKAPSNKCKIKVKRSRKNTKNTIPGIRLFDTKLECSFASKDKKKNERIPISVETNLNDSQNEVKSNQYSKSRRNHKPPSAWWAVNPEQDLLTNQKEKNEYIKTLKESPKIKRSRKNKKNTIPGIRLFDAKLERSSASKENEKNERIPIAVETNLNESQNEVKSHQYSKSRRNHRPPSAWWAVNPEQDLLTNPKVKNEYIKTMKKSPKKLQTIKGFEVTSPKNVILLSPPCEEIVENAVSGPILQNEMQQSENEGECSNSTRKRQPPSPWWAVNPENDLLIFPHRSKKTVSRKRSKLFSDTTRYKKKTKVTNNLGKKDHLDKNNKPETLSANDAKNAFKNNGSEPLVFQNENAERQSQSETDYCGKKRKIIETTENDIVHIIPGKKGKSILKANSRKYELPVSDERQMEEECEDAQTNSIFAVSKKVESRVSVLRKSLLPSVKSHRLSSFKGSLESFSAAYSKTPIASKGNGKALETKLTLQKESPTKSLAQPNSSLDHPFSVATQKKRRMVIYSDESESQSVHEGNGAVEDIEHFTDANVCDENFDKTDLSAKPTGFHLKNPFPEHADILIKTINPCSNGKILHQKSNFSKVAEKPEDCIHSNIDGKKVRGPRRKGHLLQIEEVLDDNPDLKQSVKRQKRLLKKVQFPHLSPTLEYAKVGTPKRTIIGTPRRAKMSTYSQGEDYSDSANTDSSMTEEMEGIEEICENQQELTKNVTKVKICSPQKRFPSVEKRINSSVNHAAETVTPTKLSDTFENHRTTIDDGTILRSGSGRIPLRNVRRTSTRDVPVHFYLHKSDSDSDHGDTSTDSDKDANVPNQRATKDTNKLILPSNTPNVRRSKRTRVRALEFWRGERVDYKMRPSGLVVDSVLLPEKNEKPHCKSKTKKPKQMRKKDPEVFQEQTMTTTMPTPVLDPVNGKGIYLDCVKTQEECAVQSENGLLAIKSIIQPRFSMGKLILEPLQEKGFHFLHQHTLLFYVVDGAVMATVHFSSYQLKAGDYFFVPPGNIYNIRNLQEDARACILFVRLKENVPVREDV